MKSERKKQAGRAAWLMTRVRPDSCLLVIFSLFQLWAVFGGGLDALRLRAVHIIFLFVLGALLFPTFRGRRRLSLPCDIACAGASLLAFGFFICRYDDIAMSGGWYEAQDYVVAAAGVVAALEMARRTVPGLALLALAFLGYAFAGQCMPGAFGHAGFSLERVLEHLFWGSQGLLGVGAGVSATYVFLFVLLGAFLRTSGFSAFINEFAMACVGRTAGGPAKVAVLASGLMGMINGSAVANVAATGTITIPMMQKAGYRGEFAAAVEAVASTGGQFTPPIMGAVGFIMAEFLGMAYARVMIAAAIPAFLYYLGLITSVHLEAKRLGLTGLPSSRIPAVLAVLRTRGWQVLPFPVLVATMLMGYTPVFAAGAALASSVIASWLPGGGRMGPGKIVAALRDGARSALGVGIACVIIGVVIGVVSLTGLGLSFGHAVLGFAGPGDIYPTGVFVMVMGCVLGMGVPGVAAYVIVASVAVPVLVTVGADPLPAHLFCLMYACLANITPPVAMSSFVAAGIAGCSQLKTSLIAVRLGLAGFILPFFFLNSPELLCLGGALQTVWAFLTASVGVMALAAGFAGWLFGPCGLAPRLCLLAGALCTIAPGLATDAAGLVLMVLGGVMNRNAWCRS